MMCTSMFLIKYVPFACVLRSCRVVPHDCSVVMIRMVLMARISLIVPQGGATLHEM